MAALLETYQRTDLFDQAIAQARSHATTHQDHHTSALAQVQANRRDVAQTINRYLTAFEHGTMPEDVCGPAWRPYAPNRPNSRPGSGNSVRCWPPTAPAPPDPSMLAVLRGRIHEALTQGSPQARKALLRVLVA